MGAFVPTPPFIAMKIFYWPLILLISCSSFKDSSPKLQSLYSKYQPIKNIDYMEHLASLGSIYLSSPKVSRIKLDTRSKNYLQGIFNEIYTGNKDIFQKKYPPSLYIIDSDSIFFFSLPKMQLFLSSSLITKYLKNEEILVAVITNELIKSYYSIYEKNIIVPTGYIEISRILSLTRIPTETRIEINSWSYIAMKKSGRDPLALLRWVQAQNKNSVDFMFQHGKSYKMSREEFHLKNFIAKENAGSKGPKSEPRNSSKGFYHLISSIKERT